MTQNTWQRKNFKNDRKGEKTTRWFWRAEEDQGKKMWKKRRRIRVSKLPSICFLVTSLEHILDTSIAQASDDPFRLSESHLHDSIVQHHLKILTKKELQNHLIFTTLQRETLKNSRITNRSLWHSKIQNSKITRSLWAFLHDELKSLQNLFFSKGSKREEGNRCKGCLHSGLDPRGGHQGPQFQCLLLVCAPSTTMPAALLEAHEILWDSLLPTDVFVDASKKETATQFRTPSQFHWRPNSRSNIRCQKPKKKSNHGERHSPACLPPPLLSLFVLTHFMADWFHHSIVHQ